MTQRGRPDRAALQAIQLDRLRAMAATLRGGNRFYTQKWGDWDPSRELESLEQFFQRVPFTLKSELVEDQRLHPPYGTNLTYPVEEYVRFSQTSGTTGVPLRWLDTAESWGWMVENWVQVMRAAGVRPADRIFFAFSFGPFLGFWTAFEAGLKLGALCLPGGGMSSTARLQTIRQNDVTVLCCTPTYAVRLGEVLWESGEPLRTPVRAIIAAGEPGAGVPSTRARIERLWPGARLWDHHGMTEIGPASYECPERRAVLHVLEPEFLPEVLDPATGRAVGPGERGELVLTNLGRVASPLVRYRTGDLVQQAASETCACGSAELALEGGIIGRVDDMVLVRGVNLYPSAVEDVLRRFDAVAEYRAEVHTGGAMSELKICVEPVASCGDTAALAGEVTDALRAAFNLRVPVRVEPPGSLPRFEAKAKRWVRVEESDD